VQNLRQLRPDDARMMTIITLTRQLPNSS